MENIKELKRKAYDSLLDWKKNKHSECLIIKGARQVGKTYLVERFGEKEYGIEYFVELNFLKYPEQKNIFEETLNPDELYKKLTLYFPHKKIIPHKTLLFFDEIQRCSKARTALKFLAIDNKFDVIASGSLLGLRYGIDADKEDEQVESIPVGYEKQLIMYSLDFEEYLWAKGYDKNKISLIKGYFDSKTKVPEDINKLFENMFKEYIVVGGMPRVVISFIKSNNYNVVREEQNKILASYDEDIANHAKKTDKPKIRKLYDSLPNQLAKENKKFSYSLIEKKSGAKKYGDCITWLKDCNLVHICNNVHEPLIPLKGNAINEEFKIYLNDTGLLMARYGDASKRLLLGNKLKGNVKGGIFENIISECLVKKGYSLHYYKSSDNAQEIEFIIEKGDEVIPIEVKSGNTSTLSLNTFLNKYKPSIAYKLIDGNIGIINNKYTIPHYMIIFL